MVFNLSRHPIVVDDFDAEYPGFDWKNTPDSQHPGGRDCRCPRHEHIREKTRYVRDAARAGHLVRPSLKLCPDHAAQVDQQVAAHSILKRTILRFYIRTGLFRIITLDHRNSEMCEWCRYGGGGRKIPQVPV